MFLYKLNLLFDFIVLDKRFNYVIKNNGELLEIVSKEIKDNMLVSRNEYDDFNYKDCIINSKLLET